MKRPMMPCYDQRDFEKVIIEPAAIPPEMYTHLLLCAQCRELFLYLSGWNDLFVAEQTLAQTSADQEVILQPFLLPEPQGQKFYRLAAQGEQPTDLYWVQSFSSPERGIVGRLMQEKSSLQTSLYVLADRIQDVQAVRVELEGVDLTGLTDLHGCIDFGVQPLLTCSGMRIRSPQAAFELTEMDAPVPMASEKHSFILKNECLDELFIEMNHANERTIYNLHFQRHPSKPEQNLLEIVVVTDRRAIREEFRKGVTVIETEKPEKLLRVQIY
jgi:hypothetical protein